MDAALVGVIAAFVSSAGLVVLALTDPKLHGDGRLSRHRLRRPALILTLLPGLALAGIGHGVGVLIWVAGAAILGWAVTAAVNFRRGRTVVARR